MRNRELREVVEVLESTVSANVGGYKRMLVTVACLKQEVKDLSQELEGLRGFVHVHYHLIQACTKLHRTTSPEGAES